MLTTSRDFSVGGNLGTEDTIYNTLIPGYFNLYPGHCKSRSACKEDAGSKQVLSLVQMIGLLLKKPSLISPFEETGKEKDVTRDTSFKVY